MLYSILSCVLFLVFTILSGLHFYWIFGGKWGIKQAIPTKTNKPPKLYVPKFETLIVALGLLFIALLYLQNISIISLPISKKLVAYAYWIIPSLFLIRAIGDFKYVGFFKKIVDTTFAKADTKIFSPLCLGMSAFGFLVAFNF